MGINEMQEILSTNPSDCLLPAKNRAAERMAFQHLTRVKLLHEVLGVVPHHANFFQDDLFFFFDFFGFET